MKRETPIFPAPFCQRQRRYVESVRMGTPATIHGLVFVFLFVTRGIFCVVIKDIYFLSNNSRHDYLLHGESALLNCHYILGSNNETVMAVRWHKDIKHPVYTWKRNKPPVAEGVLKGRVDLQNMSPSFINITNVHMDMHGNYTCSVETNLMEMENYANLVVIVDACSETGWTTHTDMIHCKETIRMSCVGMFPKPSPKCGILNEKTGMYLISVPIDNYKQLRNGTYEFHLSRAFDIKDYLNERNIAFSCELIVTGTQWSKGIKHKLFGDRGCSHIPPAIEHASYNMTDGKTCWGSPRDGVQVEYFCQPDYVLMGPSTLVCHNTSWVADANTTIVSDSFPYCSISADMEISFVCGLITLATVQLL